MVEYWGISRLFCSQIQKKSMSHRRLCSRFNLLYTLMSASSLTHFWPVFPLYTLRKYQKTKGFLVYLGSIKPKHWPWVKAIIKYFEVIKRTSKMIRVIFLLSLLCLKMPTSHLVTQKLSFNVELMSFLTVKIWFRIWYR